MTSVVGKTSAEVQKSLSDFAHAECGGLEAATLTIDNDNCCVITEEHGNTTIFNPYAYLEWDKSAKFISADLGAAVFSFHIHDGDLWMYTLYVNGDPVDQFNPIPDYWDENMTPAEVSEWRGDPLLISATMGSVTPGEIEKYLVRWDLDAEERIKAYPDDEFAQEDWQLADFMKKLKLPYPLDAQGGPAGPTYKFWTQDLPLKETSSAAPVSHPPKPKKPWWKFW